MPASEILCHRLKELEKILGISPEQMAEMGNCSRSTYYRYRKGESVPDLSFLNNILKNENSINVEWLLNGKEPVLKRDNNYPVRQSNNGDAPIRFFNLPLYSMEPLDQGAEGRLTIEKWKQTSKTLPLCNTFVSSNLKTENPEGLFAMKVSCDSMRPEIMPDSIVIGDKNQDDPSNEGIFVVQIDKVLRMKVIQRMPSQRVKLSTVNPKFGDLEVDMNDDDFEIMGRLIWCGSRI